MPRDALAAPCGSLLEKVRATPERRKTIPVGSEKRLRNTPKTSKHVPKTTEKAQGTPSRPLWATKLEKGAPRTEKGSKIVGTILPLGVPFGPDFVPEGVWRTHGAHLAPILAAPGATSAMSRAQTRFLTNNVQK